MNHFNDLQITSRLNQQLAFLVEIDKIKDIYRKTKLFNGSRYENDAEHSWHLCMLALILVEYSNIRNIDMLKVLKMVLIHDLGEIYIGDIQIYDKINQPELCQKEEQAVNGLFKRLPLDQQDEFIKLWKEFEQKKTPEAKFAAAIDRIEPIMQNYISKGYSWTKLGSTSSKVREVNKYIANGSEELWKFIEKLFNDADIKGYFAKDRKA